MLKSSVLELKKAIELIDKSRIAEISDMIASTTCRHGLVYVCGNGGSGATANMCASALVGIPAGAQSGVRAVSLNGNMATLTGVAERQGYRSVFSASLRSMGRSGDLLIAISGSGNSQNVIEAVLTARGIGMSTVGLTGMGGGKLADLTDCCIVVDSYDMEQIENIHSIVVHAITRRVAEHLSESRSVMGEV